MVEPVLDTVSETNDGACNGGWIEVAIEVVDRNVWGIFRVTELSFSLAVEFERIYSPHGVAVEDITGGVDTTGALWNGVIFKLDGSSRVS